MNPSAENKYLQFSVGFLFILYNIQLFTMNKNIIVFLLLLASITASEVPTFKCGLANPLKSEIQNFETGTHTFFRDKDTRTQVYEIPLKHTPPDWGFEVAASIMYLESYFDENALDFAIKVAPKSTSFQAFFIMSESAYCLAGHINYIVSSRSDLRTGTILVPDSNLLLSPDTNGELEITHYLNQRPWQPKSERIQIYYYLSGINTRDRSLNLKPKTQKSTFDGASFTVYYQITKKIKPIQNLYVSYILFPIDSSLVVFSIPDITDYIASTINNPKENSQYGFAGITQLDSEEVRAHAQQVNKTLKLLAKAGIDTHLKRYKRGYGSDGLGFSDSIGIDTYLRNPLDYRQCVLVRDCINNNGYVVEENNTKGCIFCDSRKSYNYKSLKCQCQSEYLEENGRCYTKDQFCGEGLSYFGGSCFRKIFSTDCPDDQYFSFREKKCLCSNPDRLLFEGVCVPECQGPKIFSQIAGKCVCPSGREGSHGECSRCEQNREWDEQAKECVCIAPYYGREGQDCILCSGGTEYDGVNHKCKCLAGYVQIGSFCRRSSIRNGG